MSRARGYQAAANRLDTYDFGTCSCGKLRWRSRRAAKTVIANMKARTDTRRLKVYRCLYEPAWFHVGHQPDDLAHGDISRADMGLRGDHG